MIKKNVIVQYPSFKATVPQGGCKYRHRDIKNVNNSKNRNQSVKYTFSK